MKRREEKTTTTNDENKDTSNDVNFFFSFCKGNGDVFGYINDDAEYVSNNSDSPKHS